MEEKPEIPPAKPPSNLPPAGRPPAPPEAGDADEEETAPPPAPRPERKREDPPRNYPEPVGAAEIAAANEDPPAPFGKRLSAAFIDGIVVLILFFVLSSFVMSEEFFEKDVIGILLDLRVPIALWILAMTVYFGFMTSTSGGQTLGKKAMGIRVINAEGFEEVNIGMALARGLLIAVGFALFPIGILLLLPAALGAEKRGLHDLMTGTRVIEEK